VNPVAYTDLQDTVFAHVLYSHTDRQISYVKNVGGELRLWVISRIYDELTGQIEFIGTIVLEMDIDVLATQIDILVDGVYAYLINLVDGSGNIFWSHRVDYIGNTADDLGVWQTFGHIPMNVMFAHTSWITGADKLAYVDTIERLGWTIVNFVNTSEVEATIRYSVVQLVLPMLIAGILASIVLYFLIGAALRPLRTVEQVALRVSAGDFNVTIPHVGEEDEVGRVSQAFRKVLFTLPRVTHMKAKNAIIEKKAIGDKHVKIKVFTGIV